MPDAPLVASHAQDGATPVALEWRVLDGPQRGCCLPLKAGVYRAGSAAQADLVLAGSQPALAFVLYVGFSAVALEAVDPALRLDGAALNGLHALVAGQEWTLAGVRYAVDMADAAWPLAGASGVAAAGTGEAGMPADAVPPLPAQPEAVNAGASDSASESGTETGTAAPARSAYVPAARPRSGRRWSVAAALLAALCGSAWWIARATPRAAPPATAQAVRPLDALLAAAHDYAQLQLTQNGPQWCLSGYIRSGRQRAELLRAARKLEPSLRVDVHADDELEELARETLSRFAQSGVEVRFVRYGTLSLQGHASNEALLQRIKTALREDSPGLDQIDAEPANDLAVLEVLQGLLADSDLDGRINGRMDGERLLVEGRIEASQRDSWDAVRHQLEARFGAALLIEERLAVTTAARPVAPRGDMVLSVGGAQPYVMLRDGQKEVRRAAGGAP